MIDQDRHARWSCPMRSSTVWLIRRSLVASLRSAWVSVYVDTGEHFVSNLREHAQFSEFPVGIVLERRDFAVPKRLASRRVPSSEVPRNGVADKPISGRAQPRPAMPSQDSRRVYRSESPAR